MALFGPFLLVLSTGDRDRLDRIAKAAESLDKTAAAILEKLNAQDDPDAQAAIDAATDRLKAQNDQLEGKVEETRPSP